MPGVGLAALAAYRGLFPEGASAGLTVPLAPSWSLRPRLDPADEGLIYDVRTGQLLEWLGSSWVRAGTETRVETLAFAQVPPRFDGVPRMGRPITCLPGTWAGFPVPALTFGWIIDGEGWLTNTTAQFGRSAEELAFLKQGREIRCTVLAKQTLASGDVFDKRASAAAYVQPAA